MLLYRGPAVKTLSSIVVVLVLALLTMALGQPQTPPLQDANYSLESRAAIGAHQLCSGLWVVGRVYKRTAEEILAQDIVPFRMYGWDPGFKYSVDSANRSVTVSAAGIPARTAKFNGDQGCSILPRGEAELHFRPVAVRRN